MDSIMVARLIGTWDVTIATPVGTIAVEYVFAASQGIVHGEARSRQEAVVLTDIAIDNSDGVIEVTWNQRITKPMRLNLRFEVEIREDQLTGTSKAGPLPRSAVDGTRRRKPSGRDTRDNL